MCLGGNNRDGLFWICVLLMCLVAMLAMPNAALADGTDAEARAARTACLAGDYAKGVALLAELYVSTLNDVYLFNQGRCFEQNGMYEEAIVRFREYQRKRVDAGKAPHPKAEEHIADCQRWLDKHAPPTTASAPAKTTTAPETAPAPMPLPVVPAKPEHPTETATADLLRQPEVSTDESATQGRRFYKTWWFWTTVGATVVAGSITAFLLTRHKPDACDGLGMRCVGVTGL